MDILELRRIFCRSAILRALLPLRSAIHLRSCSALPHITSALPYANFLFRSIARALFSIAGHPSGLRIEQASQIANATTVAEGDQVKVPPAPRVVAFYLPQFHPIPENDLWWGRGFTEWTNVTKSRPLFPGHRQPRLPGELGFTDLRLPEMRAAQAERARAYGVSAFCYYYYWFGEGRRLLHRPLDEVLASGEPDFPFMIYWANEPWSRNWDGANTEVLIAQDYPDGWIEAFARVVAPILRDTRYVRLSGPRSLPVLMIYKNNACARTCRNHGDVAN